MPSVDKCEDVTCLSVQGLSSEQVFGKDSLQVCVPA